MLLFAGATALAADGAAISKAQCAKCHGDTGHSDTTIAKAMNVPALAGDANVQKMSDADIVVRIKGNAKHPPTVKSRSDDDINAVGAYVEQPPANRRRIDARAVTRRAGVAVGGRERFATAFAEPTHPPAQFETSGDGSAGGPTLPRGSYGEAGTEATVRRQHSEQSAQPRSEHQRTKRTGVWQSSRCTTLTTALQPCCWQCTSAEEWRTAPITSACWVGSSAMTSECIARHRTRRTALAHGST